MNKNRRLRIIMGEEKFATERHARTLMRSLEKHDHRHPTTVKPRGVSSHTAQFPLLCSECGATYWSRDEYASHMSCKGSPDKTPLGF